MTVLVRSDASAKTIYEAAQAVVHKLQPDTAIYDVETMGDRLDEALALHRFATLLLGLFALLALLLASIGIYAVMAFAVAQRHKEIGIRLALGARPGQVVSLLVRQGCALAITGVVIGVVAAAAVATYVEPLLFEVSPWDPLIYVLCAFAVAGPACLACYLAARRATRIDPMFALRGE
jgi:putative ABC transport system permease protein